MLARLKVVCVFMVILMLIGLITANYHASAQEGLLIAIPRISGISTPVTQVDEAGNRGMPFTFENRQAKTITVLGNNHGITLIGTNHNYPFIMGHKLTHGRFFREYAVRYGHRVAVLNQHAAFTLFGTINATGNELFIDNSPYIVVGVIDDGCNEELNIYVPTTHLNNTAEAITANTALSPTRTNIEVLNEWQRMDIEGQNYRFVDFGALQTIVHDKVIIAFSLIAVAILLFFLSKTYASAKVQASALHRVVRDAYIKEAIVKPPAWKLLCICVVSVSIVAATAALIMNSFMRILVAYDTRGMLANVQSTAFSRQIATIARWYNLSNLFSLGFILFFAMLILVYIKGD